jgi:two-component system, NarL family, nitrate/nitrite response regulator NarL
MVMRLLILLEVGVYRDSLARTLARDERFDVAAVAVGGEEALAALKDMEADIVLVDTHLPASADTVRTLVAAAPRVKVVALNVSEVDGEVIALAEAGAAGYVTREGSMEDLAAVAESVSRGETLCSPGIAATLFRRVAALARDRRPEPIEEEKLTAREIDVLRLIEEGHSNKEIAKALSIELPTVKNHVHHILEKLNVHRRAEAAARVRRHGLPRLGGLEDGQRN